MPADPVIGGPTEIRSTKEVMVFHVRHLNDEEFMMAPAIAIESKTGTVYVTPGQVGPLVNALVEMMNEVL